MWRPIVFTAFLIFHGSAASASSSEPAVGSMAPDFKGKNMVTGDAVDLGAQRGKLVIVTFWATWCAPCRSELPILEGAQKLLGKDKLMVLAVNFQDSPDAVRALKKLAATWQLTLVEDRGGRIADRYKIRAIPHLFMIDHDGKIVANHTGYGDRSLEELVSDINKALHVPSGADQQPAPASGDVPNP
jgi:thiol-disulfide isomerase/thioredoxin